MKQVILLTWMCGSMFLMTLGQQLSPSVVCSGSHDYQDENMSWYGTLGGVFTETLINSDCIVTQGFQQGAPATLGIHEAGSTPSFELSPNPATSFLTLSIPHPSGALTWNLKVFDVSSRLRFERTIYAAQETINIQELPRGLYFLQLSQGNEVLSVVKFIKN